MKTKNLILQLLCIVLLYPLSNVQAANSEFETGMFLCDGGEITFDGFFFATQEICLAELPTTMNFNIENDGIGDSYMLVLTTDDGTILDTTSTFTLNTDYLETGIYRVYGVSYGWRIFGNNPGQNISEITGYYCSDVSDYLVIDVMNCNPECPEEGTNFGDACDDGNPNTYLDEITEDCNCVGTPFEDCDTSPNQIIFAGGLFTQNICANASNPELIDVEFSELGSSPSQFFAIRSAGGVILETVPSLAELVALDFRQWGSTTIYIHSVGYDPENSNIDDLLLNFETTNFPISILQFEGCVSISIPILTTGVNCTIAVGCGELGVAIGSPCDDGNAETENDLITEDCECEGTPVGLCDVEAEGIGFIGGGISRETCYNNSESSNFAFGITSLHTGPDWFIVVVDPAGEFMTTTINMSVFNQINFNAFGAGAHFIHVVRYDALASNADELYNSFLDEGANANLSDLEGCYELSNALEVIGINCDSEFDCHELMVDVGSPCDDFDPLTENDIINNECGCEGTPIQTFDCPELMADHGDFCDDMNPETEYDVITEECVCVGLPSSDCNVVEATIEFYNPDFPDAELDDIQNFCATNGEPSHAYLRYVSPSSAPSAFFVVVDELSNVLDFPISLGFGNTFDFDEYGIQTVTLYTVNFYPLYSNASSKRIDFFSGVQVNLSDFEGCFELSNPLQMVGLECVEIFDCPELSANFGEPCDDLNPETENDIITGLCTCAGTPLFECDLNNADIEFYDPENEGAEFGETLEICATDGLLSYVTIGFSSFANGDNFHFILTDNAGNYLDVVSSFGPANTYDFDQYGIGTIYIQPVRYYQENANADELRFDFLTFGTPANLSDLEGCFVLSNQLQVIGEDCSVIYDCPELEANIGDSCDDGNELTENDLVNELCDCEGTFVFVCGAEGGTISLFDPEVEGSNLGETLNICVNDGIPSYVNVQFDEEPVGPNYYMIFTDLFGGLLEAIASTTIEGINFDQYGTGEIYIQYLSFYQEYSNATQIVGEFTISGIPHSLSDFEGCFDLSNQILVIGEECEEEFDCPELDANIGDTCDDMNENTENDVVNEECACAGTMVEDCEVEAIGIVFSDLTYETIICVTDGIPSNIDISVTFLPEILDHYFIVHDEAGNFLYIATNSDVIQLIDFDQFGLNTVFVQWLNFDASESNADELAIQFFDDEVAPNISDLEGCYALSGELEVEGINCDPNYCPELEANIGDACDDGDPDTDNDIINDDCECEGGPITTYDCPLLEANYDDPCDDGDPLTMNDFVGPACECIGIPVEVDCPLLGLNIGAPCDDGNPATVSDTLNINCECVGIPEIFDCTQLFANIGDPCDDGNPLTLNDVVNEICECEGIPELVDCPQYGLNIGDACDDGNPTTFNDTLNENCECEGEPLTIVDCPDLGLNIGDSCDDGDPLTINDMVNANCGCSGTPELVDCPDLGLNIGDSCDDGDPLTSSDVVDENCGCAGIPEIVICTELELEIGDPCDDGNVFTENDTVNGDCECEGTPILTDCSELFGDIGDPCPLGDTAGTISEDCECIPNDDEPCDEWVMYLNDNHDGQTDIYDVDISSGDAVLTFIVSVGYQGHIAYNSDNNLIYVIHNGNGSYVTVDPHSVVPEVSAPIMLSQEVPNVTTAAFSPNGKLLIGSYTEDVIYSVDVSTNIVSEWDSYAPIHGGDIAFDELGKLYLATRAGNGFYQAFPEAVMPDQLLANIPSGVTGLALMQFGQMLTSHNGNTELQMITTDGLIPGISFPIVLEGVPFLPLDGDMTSGCVSGETNEDECDIFSTFYIHQGDGLEGAQLFEVTFNESEANLELLAGVEFPAHIGYAPEEHLVFLVRNDGSMIRIYDPVDDAFIVDIPIVGDLNQVVAVVYNPEEEVLYIGDSQANEIHTIDLNTGVAAHYADAPVQGGDLVFQNDKLYLATRAENKLYEIVGGVAVEVANIPMDVNGIAAANNTSDVLVANYGSTVFTQLNAMDGSIVNTFDIMSGGLPFQTLNGDFASGCTAEVDGGEGGVSVFFGSSSEVEVKPSILSAYPNPTHGQSQIEFTSGQSGKMNIVLHNMKGQAEATLFYKDVKAGQKDRIDFDASKYSNGLYLIKLSINDESITEKMLIAK